MNNKVKKVERIESNLICSQCRQAKGITDNDEYECKWGLNSIFVPKPKCKYFKRDSKYVTCDGVAKIKSIYFKGIETSFKYYRGKFIKTII